MNKSLQMWREVYDEAFRGGSRALGEAQERCALVLALHQADMRATQQEKLREGL